jgi:hypothetical protein
MADFDLARSNASIQYCDRYSWRCCSCLLFDHGRTMNHVHSIVAFLFDLGTADL